VRCVATSFGSAGDFLPTLVIAKALRTEGHEVVFVSNPFHERRVRAAGLEFVPAGEHVDVFGEIENNPIYLDTVRGAKALWTDVGEPFVAATYRAVRDLMRDFRPDVVMGSNLAFGVFWAASEQDVPQVMVSATPLSWLSKQAPMQFTDRALPQWLLPPLSGATRSLLAWTFDRWLRRLARALGTTASDPSMTGVERDLALHLGMWPSLLRDAAPGDLPNMRVCGFARAGQLGGESATLPAEVEAFLSSGPPPVVVGLGSAFAIIAGDLLTDVAAACAALGHRCLVVGHPSTTATFPGDTLAVTYAPYHLVFPRAAAVVIHGGAGTTGEALRSGRPAVVVPLAYDQFALSWQVERVGAGVRVSKSARTRKALAAGIHRAVSDLAIVRRSAEIANLLAADRDGAEVAAEMIGGLGGRSSR
jgi:rhamnosyltransferase subunit B